MSGNEFFRTQMGHRFYEATMPKIVEQLERLNNNLAVLVAELRMHRDAGVADPPAFCSPSVPRRSNQP